MNLAAVVSFFITWNTQWHLFNYLGTFREQVSLVSVVSLLALREHVSPVAVVSNFTYREHVSPAVVVSLFDLREQMSTV